MRAITLSFLMLGNLPGGVVAAVRGSTRRTQGETPSLKACKEASMDYENQVDSASCDCEDSDNGTTLLTCMDSCNYCNDDMSTCGNPEMMASYDLSGTKESASDMFMYNKGKSETIEVSLSDCEEDMFGRPMCNRCDVSVDGTKCNVCFLTICDWGEFQFHQKATFDCQNVEVGSTYNLCYGINAPEGSVFEYMNGDDGAFDVCYPTTDMPTVPPTDSPTDSPSAFPSDAPSLVPSDLPTENPTMAPTDIPSEDPSTFPSDAPSFVPSGLPTKNPTLEPTVFPSEDPSTFPSDAPSYVPSYMPTKNPTLQPTDSPSGNPSFPPSDFPSALPTDSPSDVPSDVPSLMPSDTPTSEPGTSAPTVPDDPGV